MTLNGDAKFKGKLTRGLKNDIRNLVNFNASSGKSGNLHVDVPLLSKAFFRSKITKQLSLMILNSDLKFLEKLTFFLKSNMSNLVNFNGSSGKSENLSFDGLLL